MTATVTDISTARARAREKWKEAELPRPVLVRDCGGAEIRGTLVSITRGYFGIPLYEVLLHKSKYVYLREELDFL